MNDRLSDTRASELALVLAGALVPILVFVSAWTRGFVGPWGQSWAIIVGLVLGALTCTCWAFTPRLKRDPWVVSWLSVFMLFWLWVSLMRYFDAEAVDYSTILVPLILGIALWRPPPVQSVTAGMISASVSTVVVAILDTTLRLTGSTRIDPAGPTPVQWGWVDSFTQVGESWKGPFEWVSYASFAFTFVLLLGLYGRVPFRLFWIVTGATGVLLAQQLGALISLVAASITVWALLPSLWPRQLTPRVRSWLGVTGLVVVICAAWLQDRTFHGRTPIWSEFWVLWRSEPLRGVGLKGVEESLIEGRLPTANWNAHNWLLDSGTKYGLFAALAVILLTAIMLFVTASVVTQTPVSLALTVAVVVFTLSDEPFTHGYWTIPLLWAFMAVLLAGAVRSNRRLESTSMLSRS